jgi:hypothetical protein
MMHMSSPPRPPREMVPDIPPHVDAAILRALEKDRAARFQTMAELQGALSGTSGPGLLRPDLMVQGQGVAPASNGPAQRALPLAPTIDLPEGASARFDTVDLPRITSTTFSSSTGHRSAQPDTATGVGIPRQRLRLFFAGGVLASAVVAAVVFWPQRASQRETGTAAGERSRLRRSTGPGSEVTIPTSTPAGMPDKAPPPVPSMERPSPAVPIEAARSSEPAEPSSALETARERKTSRTAGSGSHHTKRATPGTPDTAGTSGHATTATAPKIQVPDQPAAAPAVPAANEAPAPTVPKQTEPQPPPAIPQQQTPSAAPPSRPKKHKPLVF